jgi:antitoxin CptB
MNEARIKWLLRRGMKELDVMFTRYYQQRYAVAPEAERAAFIALLDGPQEPDIYAWAMGFEPPPVQFADVIREFRQYR